MRRWQATTTISLYPEYIDFNFSLAYKRCPISRRYFINLSIKRLYVGGGWMLLLLYRDSPNQKFRESSNQNNFKALIISRELKQPKPTAFI